MVIAKEIEYRVGLLPEESIFTIEDLHLPSEWWENVRVKLGRMVKEGILRRIGKGRFYRPVKSMFGELVPNQEETVKDLLVKDGQTIGYITGYYRWNQMGLTSQISGIIQIATNQPKRNLKRGNYTVRFIRQPNPINDDDIKYLIILDAISNIRKIPDTTIAESVSRLSAIIEKLNDTEMKQLVKLSKKYPARLRALLGAILDNIGKTEYTKGLSDSLNPLTNYSYPELAKFLPNPSKWHIK